MLVRAPGTAAGVGSNDSGRGTRPTCARLWAEAQDARRASLRGWARQPTKSPPKRLPVLWPPAPLLPPRYQSRLATNCANLPHSGGGEGESEGGHGGEGEGMGGPLNGACAKRLAGVQSFAGWARKPQSHNYCKAALVGRCVFSDPLRLSLVCCRAADVPAARSARRPLLRPWAAGGRFRIKKRARVAQNGQSAGVRRG